jgi:hypothetical protein
VASPGKKSFLLRIDPALWAEIERLAAQDLRSANAQVEYLLREGLTRRGRQVPGRGSSAIDPNANSSIEADSDEPGP